MDQVISNSNYLIIWSLETINKLNTIYQILKLTWIILVVIEILL